MFVTVLRTLLVRVRPNVLLVFKPYDNDRANASAPNSRGKRTPAVESVLIWTVLACSISGRFWLRPRPFGVVAVVIL